MIEFLKELIKGCCALVIILIAEVGSFIWESLDNYFKHDFFQLSSADDKLGNDTTVLRGFRDYPIFRNLLLEQIQKHQTEVTILLDYKPDEMIIHGPLVVYIDPDSSAARCDLKVGDVITSINGDPIIEWLLKYKWPKEKLELTVQRLPGKAIHCGASPYITYLKNNRLYLLAETILFLVRLLLKLYPGLEETFLPYSNEELLYLRFENPTTCEHLISFVKTIQHKRSVKLVRNVEDEFGFHRYPYSTFISSVVPNSEAERKGLKVGDWIDSLAQTSKKPILVKHLKMRFEMRLEEEMVIASFEPWPETISSEESITTASNASETPASIEIKEFSVQVVNEIEETDTADFISWRSGSTDSEHSSRPASTFSTSSDLISFELIDV